MNYDADDESSPTCSDSRDRLAKLDTLKTRNFAFNNEETSVIRDNPDVSTRSSTVNVKPFTDKSTPFEAAMRIFQTFLKPGCQLEVSFSLLR